MCDGSTAVAYTHLHPTSFRLCVFVTRPTLPDHNDFHNKCTNRSRPDKIPTNITILMRWLRSGCLPLLTIPRRPIHFLISRLPRNTQKKKNKFIASIALPVLTPSLSSVDGVFVRCFFFFYHFSTRHRHALHSGEDARGSWIANKRIMTAIPNLIWPKVILECIEIVAPAADLSWIN